MTSKIFIMSWFWRKWSCNEKSTNKLKIHIESSLSINQWQKNPWLLTLSCQKISENERDNYPWLLIIISGHHPKTLNSICFIKVSDQKKTVREGRYEIWKKWSISKNVSVSHKIASTKAPDVVLTFNIIRTIIRCLNVHFDYVFSCWEETHQTILSRDLFVQSQRWKHTKKCMKSVQSLQ